MTVEITTATGAEMLRSVTPIYNNDDLALAIFEANGKLMHEISVVIEELKFEMYPQNATWTIEYWEQMLGIKTNKNLSDADRVQMVLFELNKYFSVTRSHMESMVNSFVPSKTAKVIEIPVEYAFRVNLPLEEDVNYPATKAMVEDIKPAHLEALYFFVAAEQFKLSIKQTTAILTSLVLKLNPWAQAGLTSSSEDVLLNGTYLLDGKRFLNGFYNKDGPAHQQKLKLYSNVVHDFGFHEVNLLPSLDGEFNLNGEIKLQNEPQNVRLTTIQDAKLNYKKKEIIQVSSSLITPSKTLVSTKNGVVPMNGQSLLNGSISLDQALLNHSGLFRVKKAGSIIEEVAI